LQLGELSPKVRGLIHAQKDRNPAFDLIGYDREDLRNIPFLDRKAALARLLRDAKVGILLNEQIAEDGLTVFAQACQLGAEGIVSKKVDNSYRSGRRGNVIVVADIR
jgi:bifunctional non-homologous end joining protein LigD